ncbi:MAG: helix-turn-helix transcriptional regulator [Cyclobacteriaceae bacterium]|nr:helix-turn-helix transcriptional regulator [Cyclobacteriaceae bacterium]
MGNTHLDNIAPHRIDSSRRMFKDEEKKPKKNILKIDAFVIKFQRFVKEEKFRKENVDKFDTLTLRETQVLKHVVGGDSNPKISTQLNISRSTVEQHRKNINRKLEIENMADVFRYALAFNLVD